MKTGLPANLQTRIHVYQYACKSIDIRVETMLRIVESKINLATKKTVEEQPERVIHKPLSPNKDSVSNLLRLVKTEEVFCVLW